MIPGVTFLKPPAKSEGWAFSRTCRTFLLPLIGGFLFLPAQHLRRFWMLFSPFDHSSTCAGALLLGPRLALLMNLFIKISGYRDKDTLVIRGKP